MLNSFIKKMLKAISTYVFEILHNYQIKSKKNRSCKMLNTLNELII